MSEFKGTPGPWRYSPSVPDRSFEAQVWDASGKALLYFAESLAIGDEADANARLIAAAPEMYALIRDLSRITDIHQANDLCGRAKELIARITGD